MKAIGIDIGTTTISGVVLDVEKKHVVEAKTIQNDSFISTDNNWERVQDVSVILEKAQALVDELLDHCPDCISIGLTGQMHGILYIDQKGECVSPLYTWQDGRGNLSEFGGKSIVELVKEETGLAVSTGYGLITHLYHCKKDMVPELAVSFCTIGDYLGMKLADRAAPVVHASNAASLGFFDGSKCAFRQDIIEKMGMNSRMLPEITDEFEILGQYKGIPVTVVLGDNQASFLGSVGFQENTILLNMGTGGQISILSDQLFEENGIEARPFAKGKYLLVGASLCGGRAYAVLEKFFRNFYIQAGGEDKALYEVLEKLARAGMQCVDSMKVTTLFNGTRVDPSLRGSIINLSENNFTPEGMTYGVLHGMVKELYDMYQLIYQKTGIKAMHLVASGNGLRKNKVLQEISSKMFEAELSLAIYQEEAACGAAISSTMGAVQRGR